MREVGEQRSSEQPITATMSKDVVNGAGLLDVLEVVRL